MNVFLLIDDLAYGGPARQLSLLAAALPRDHFTARAFTARPAAPWSRALAAAGVPVASGERRRLFDVRPFLALRLALREAAPDVVHVFGLAALRTLALVGGRHGARVLLSAAAGGERRARLGRFDRWLIAALTDRVVARGPAEAEHLVRLGVPVRKVAEVPPGVPPANPPKLPRAAWCRSLGVPEGARLLAAVGPLEPAKGFRDAIWAFDILQFLYDDLHLLLAGTGSQGPRLREFTHVTRSTGRVHFLGARADLDDVLGHADLVWVPSRADRGATVALEAMAAGRPVVASRWPGLAEVIVDGQTGVMVMPGDQAALARETRALLDDAERRRRLGESGHKRAADHFSVENMARRWAALYESLGGRLALDKGRGGVRQ